MIGVGIVEALDVAPDDSRFKDGSERSLVGDRKGHAWWAFQRTLVRCRKVVRMMGLLNQRMGNATQFCRLMVLAMFAAVSVPVSLCESDELQDELQIRNHAVRSQDPTPKSLRAFRFRTARVPVFADVDLGITDPPPVLEREIAGLVAALDANPRRLLALRFMGMALRFQDLNDDARQALLGRRGEEVVGLYNDLVARRVLTVLDEVHKRRPNAPLAIQGLPFEGWDQGIGLANEAYGEVLAQMDGLVLRGVIMVAGSSDEASMLHRSCPYAIAVADGRPIIFAANSGWRIAIQENASGLEAVAKTGRLAISLATESLGGLNGEQGAQDSVEDLEVLGSRGSSELVDEGQSAEYPASQDEFGFNGQQPRDSGATSPVHAGGGGGPSGSAGATYGDPSNSDEDVAWDPSDEFADAADDLGNAGDSSGGTDVAVEPGGGLGDSSGSSSGESQSGEEPDGISGASGDDTSDSGEGGISSYERPSDLGEHGPIDDWSTWDELRDLILAAPDGSVLDLRGRGFRPAAIGEAPISNDGKSLTLMGGRLTGAWELDWVPHAGGLFIANLDLSWLNNDHRVYLIDEAQSVVPGLVQIPSPPEEFAAYRFGRTPSWWTIRDSNEVNGVIHTDRGDNVIGGLITGITINDAAIRGEIAGVLGANGLADVVVMYHASSNYTTCDGIASWNHGSGRIQFTGTNAITYNGYMRFCLSGGTELEPGEYSFVPSANQVWYRPRNGDPSSAELPVTKEILHLTGGTAVVQLIGVTLNGATLAPSGTAALVGGAISRLVARDCHFSTAQSGIYSLPVDLERCYFHQFDRFGVQTESGARIENVEIRDTARSSAILVMGGEGAPADALPETVIRRCLISIPASVHGQCVSLYTCSWQNATIEENIFLNSRRAIAFQPNPVESLRRTSAGRFIVRNNLFVLADLPWGEVGGGQKLVAFNKDPDDHLSLDQKVKFCHNSICINANVLGGDLNAGAGVDISKLRRSEVTVESNIVANVNAPPVSEGGPPHRRFGNLLWLNPPGYGSAWGSSDLPTPNHEGQLFDSSLLLPRGIAATAASDNGPIGIRWARVPSMEEVGLLGVDWAEHFVPMQLPGPPSDGYSTTYAQQDWR